MTAQNKGWRDGPFFRAQFLLYSNKSVCYNLRAKVLRKIHNTKFHVLMLRHELRGKPV